MKCVYVGAGGKREIEFSEHMFLNLLYFMTKFRSFMENKIRRPSLFAVLT